MATKVADHFEKSGCALVSRFFCKEYIKRQLQIIDADSERGNIKLSDSSWTITNICSSVGIDAELP